MCSCLTFCWIRQLVNTTLIGPRAIWRVEGMCTLITFCWTRQLANVTLIGPVAFGERELCVLVLHYVAAESYITLL